MTTTVAVVPYKPKTLKNGESPLMLKITKDRKLKYASLGVSLYPKHWNKEIFIIYPDKQYSLSTTRF